MAEALHTVLDKLESAEPDLESAEGLAIRESRTGLLVGTARLSLDKRESR
jgi:hypothetical protein